MASLTIRDLPERTLDALKSRADMNRRSLNGEMLCNLDHVVLGRSDSCPLVTANTRHFSRFEGLELLDWTKLSEFK